MRKTINAINEKIRTLGLIVFIAVSNKVVAYGGVTDGTAQFDNILSWLSGWTGKIGIIVTLWGAIQIAFSISNEDAGQKRKGILEAISGLMVMAISYGYRTIIGV